MDDQKRLRKAVKELCKAGEKYKRGCSRFLEEESLDRCRLLNILADFLLEPDSTLTLANHVPYLLLELLFLASERQQHVAMSVALGKLVRFFPVVLGFSLQYFEKNANPFWDEENDEPVEPKRRRVGDSVISDLEIVQACCNLLEAKCNYFRLKWDWSLFMETYLDHAQEKVRWLAGRALALVTGMTDSQMRHFELQLAEPGSALYYRIERQKPLNNAVQAQNFIVEEDAVIKTSRQVISVCGINLPVWKVVCQQENENFIMVDSAIANLRRLALAVASGRGVYLHGPVGSGKTSVVEHLAKLTGRIKAPDFVKVQLGDEMDSKMLLGTYRCTDVPGEFVWQPGILTQAVMGGYWILLEDVDSAAADVAVVLASLVETGTLSVPGYRDSVKAKPGFQLFVTQRVVASRHSKHQNIPHKHWLSIAIKPFSKEELVLVIEKMYPVLQTVATRMVEVFLLFSAGQHTKEETTQKIDLPARRRLTSTRDLMKWCARAVEGFNVASQESALKILQDAIDIFCLSVADSDSRLTLAVAVASHLGIVKTKAEYFCKDHKPVISLTTTHLSAGRTTLLRQSKAVSRRHSMAGRNFSLTRPAACLLESIACCVRKHEPVLLVGETGTGKTTAVQHLATMTGHQLIVINMNQQSDSADLLGGYKPVDFKHVVRPVREEFEQLFRKYFASQPNHTFLNNYMIFFNTGRWGPLIRAMRHVQSTALKQLIATSGQNPKANAMRSSWQKIGLKLHKLEAQLRTKSALAFTFIEGTLIKALQKGHWVLLDEINLASAETLECLSGLLEGSTGSLYLLERGDQEPVVRHPDFHLFACMNPATDVGKKDLPAGLRNRFTEFFVDELTDKRDLIMLMNTYLQPISPSASRISSIVEFYLKVRKEASEKLTDGVGYRPHYSLRTLCRALIVGAQNKCGSVPRSLYEGLCLSFLSQLDHTSYPAVQQAISDKLFVGEEKKSVLNALLPQPAGGHGDEYINFEGYWVKRGKLVPYLNDKYILTPSVKRNLHDLVRVVALSDHPVLLQGETSVGKTSLITYLAAASGNMCVRINNHEHTDLQEYIGSYCANQTGQLVFKEGVLVEAMREGSWIILDELNLAPSDVLEALNRVLDDNRELFIPETQQTIKAHPQFRLFATQNPPGLYGGRKVLSRAFQNRFVELHFGEIPPNELVTILNIRCEMPQSYCRKLVEVMRKLQLRRRGSAAFAGKQGFMTLRDLFRWGERYRQAKPKAGQGFLDWEQYVADEGFLVLAGRVRKAEEAEVIKEVIEEQFKRKIDSQKLFTLSEETSPITRTVLENLVAHPLPGFEHVVWTFNVRRLAVLLGKAIELNEPVLLVGLTGCGKTTLCQMLAAASNQSLYTVNCHMHTESADFLGGLRPVRDHSITDQKEEDAQKRLFEWVDGPLIKAMTGGDLFLADEISLADDSVLERLNSLLEPERTLLLAEKGGDTAQVVVAKESFQFIGTMNPGGDYGKKELSPALRNRFTEIWCEPVSRREDLFAIIEHNLKSGLSLGNQEDGSTGIGNRLLDFLEWFKGTEVGKRFTLSVRDIMTWVNFINTTAVAEGDNTMGGLDLPAAYVNGACLTFLDSFGSGVTSSERPSTLKRLREASLRFLRKQVEMEGNKEADLIGKAKLTETCFGIHPFYIPRGTAPVKQDSFTFSTPTTKQNTVRVLRALQVNKPILLEGSPGTGKTSLVAAIAKIAGHHLVRINLSDQTDVSDLFGADLPVEGGQGGQFAWQDGPFLRALKAGHWILLDELNLASQSVLEGLNACLDHRGEVFVPELGRTFYIQSSSTKLFGTQNPLRQGGARRGLPQSFLNRFTQIFIDALTSSDLCLILSETFPSLPHSMIRDMVKFNMRLAQECGEHGSWGHRGRPWDMNLRDLTRWCQIVECSEQVPPGKSVSIIYVDRMRTKPDRMKVKQIYEEEMGQKYPFHLELPRFHVTPNMVYVGDVVLNRRGGGISSSNLAVLRQQFSALRSLMRCVKMDWLTILVGPSGSGKTSVVQLLADLTGRELRVLCVNPAMDTCDILGGFEQVDCSRELDEIGNKVELHILSAIRNSLLNKDTSQASQLLQQLGKYWKTTYSEEQNWEQRLEVLLQLLAKLPCGEEQQYIEQRLNILKNEIGPSSTSGGKFKWVDSILVKALRDGCWLLVDNVNLCSPAVLDRLNAVLEPGGQLTIGERGVDADGNLVTITPHPDFRLFLAMDPINGEISRAMRNRGVEIFLNEDLSQSVLDARALLAQQGLNQIFLQDALLCVHRDVTQGQQNVERISDLLRAAFLLCQYTLHGREALKSLQATCSEVYQLENVTIKSTRSSESAPPAPVSLSAHRVDSDSSLAMVYLQGSSLLNQELLSEILPGLPIHLNITPHLVILLYECASFNDLTLRHHWLDTLVAKDKNITNLSNTLYETIASMLPQLPQNSAEDISNLPWDLRHLPELVPHNYESSAPERLLTLLHFRATKVLLAHERVERKTLTVECYSNAAKEGQVREDITTHAAIVYFASYLDQFDVLLETLLKSSSVIPTQNCFYVLLWRFRLGAMGELPLVQEGKRTSVVVQETISCLSVHYHWLFKWTIPVLNRMLNQDPGLKSSFVVRQFETTNKIIKMSLPNILSPLQKIGKLVRQFMGQPSPRSSVEYAELLLKLARISDILNIWQEDKPSWKSCVGFLSTQKGVQAWETIVSAYSSLLPDGNVSFTEVESSLTEVENDLEVLKSEHSVEDFTAVQLWPLRELVVLLLSVALRRELFEHKHTSVVKENLKVQLCGLSSIPATLAALLSMQDGKISMELLYNMLQHQKMSPATKHPKIWVTLDSETDEDRIERTYSTEREETMQTPNPLHSPALTVLATQLLLPCKNQLEYVVTLGSLKARICQLSILKQFLWRNMSSLTSDLLNYRQNETSSAVSCCRKLLGALNRAALNKETEPDIDVLMKALLKDGNKQSKEFCEILSELCDAMSSINESSTVAENGKWLIQVGQIWALLGYLQVIMYTTLYPIDPVEKKTLKLEYVQKEITQLQTELQIRELQSSVSLGVRLEELNESSVHPHIKGLRMRLNHLQSKEKQLVKSVAVRPTPPQYSKISADILHYTQSLASREKALKLCNQLITVAEQLCDPEIKIKPYGTTTQLLLEAQSWQESQEGFCSKLHSEHLVWYPDITLPILTAATMLSHGIKLLVDAVGKLMLPYAASINGILTSLIHFPSQNSEHLLNDCTALLRQVFVGEESDKSIILEYRLLKAYLRDQRNIAIVQNEFEEKPLEIFFVLIKKIAKIWKQEEDERVKLEKEKESLYVIRCAPQSEEQKTEDEIEQLFPSLQSTDFYDFEQSDQDLEESIKHSSSTNKIVELMNREDAEFIARLHSQIMTGFTYCHWLVPKVTPEARIDFVRPLLERFQVFSELLEKISTGADSSVDLKLQPSIMVITSAELNFAESGEVSFVGNDMKNPSRSSVQETRSQNLDFYHDSNINEAKSCLPVLNALTSRVQELLQEWPQHPTLMKIWIIVKRILAFPLTSPLARFQTGMELLLAHIYEWEENAHSGVSIATHLTAVSSLIATWRKLQLQSWRDCLSGVQHRFEQGAAKWWLHLYSVIEDYVKPAKEPITSKDILEGLVDLMEKSSLGEFNSRLTLLLSFHCHVQHMQSSTKQNELMLLLWNVHKYYEQFSQTVNVMIDEQKAPIEKKLKDCVKIFRWEDKNYWTIRETVRKVHKTLHKHIKEYQAVLNQSVCLAISNYGAEMIDTSTGIRDRPQRNLKQQYKSLMTSKSFLSSRKQKTKFQAIGIGSTTGLLSKSEKYFLKALDLSQSSIEGCPYGRLTRSTEALVGTIIETYQEQSRLSVPDCDSASEHSKKAKECVRQRRSSLNILFSTLRKLGLSYRTGIVKWHSGEDLTTGKEIFMLPPIALNVSLTTIPGFKQRRISKDLSNSWKGCEMYFQRSLARLKLLKSALQNPSKDIGHNEIEKCWGFSLHLMSLVREQKIKLAETTKMLVFLRCHATQLCSILDPETNLPSQHFIQEWIKRLKDLLALLMLYLEQLWVLLNACPSKCSTEELPLLSLSQLPPMLQCLKGDSIWSSTVDKVHTLAAELGRVRNELEKSEATPSFFRKEQKTLLLSSSRQLKAIESGYTKMKSLATTVAEIRKTFECEPTERSTIVVELTLLEQRMFSEAEEFNAALLNQSDHDGEYVQADIDDFRVELEILIMKTLSGIEVLYKEFACDITSSADETDDEEKKELKSELEPNHLVEHLVESMFNVFPKLGMKVIEKQLCIVTARLQRLLNNAEQRNICKRMLTNYLPCLDQLLLLHEFLVTQQVGVYRVSVKLLSILLVIFINLVQKGFCIPAQKTEKDTRESKSSGGMGLAEGEGDKDVSERIESEDQLEEAKSKDAEKEQQDDKDCKEEDGIQMSEDFEGKIQDTGDKEEEDNEPSEEEEDKEDMDKEMGDTAEGADTLDSRIWGLDSEEEDEESDPKEEEAESGKGEETGESEIVSKSKQETANEEEPSRQKEKQKKKDINEMDEDGDGDEDQVNPYHGQMEPQQEPDPLDLPEDMQLDEGEKPEDAGEGEDTENPFDIDTMKEHKPPEPDSERKEDESNTEEKEENIGDENESVSQDEKQEETDNWKEEKEDESEIGKKDEHKAGEVPKEEENNQEMAQPSVDESTAEPAEKAEDMDRKFGSRDKVKGEDQKEEDIKGEEASGEVGDKEQQGVGQSQMQEESEAGHGGKAAAAALSTDSQPVAKQLEKRPSKGETRDDRTLGDDTGPLKKRLRMLNVAAEEEEEEKEEEVKESEWYQHIKETKDKSYTQAMDAATKEQAEKQFDQWSKEEKDLKENEKEEEDINMQDEDMELVFNKTRTGRKTMEIDSLEDAKEEDIKEEDFGEMVETLGAARGSQESAYYTSIEQDTPTTAPDMHAIRNQLEQQLATWNQPPPDSEAQKIWEEFSTLTLPLARDLSEQLRLVLEPTKASRLKGDYRTGKRINMRKVIPYIASEFRKDKIWLRRTKPSKREYQIVIAIDDSSSMADSHSKELAFESLALVTKALTLVEAGELAVVNFGEATQVLHPLGETFTEQNGAKLLQQLSFGQKGTNVGQLVTFATAMLANQKSQSGDRPAQLLIIVSDGRGVRSEGPDVVQQAVRYAKHAGVLMVFIIIDSPANKDSILELQSVDIIDGKPTISSYLDNFPFPYYMILKDISALPAVLSDALRQWFELIANTDSC